MELEVKEMIEGKQVEQQCSCGGLKVYGAEDDNGELTWLYIVNEGNRVIFKIEDTGAGLEADNVWSK